MNKIGLYSIGAFLLVAAFGATKFFSPRPVATPTTPPPVSFQNNNATTSDTTNVRTPTTSNPTRTTAPILPAIVKGDNIISWDFAGAYANNPELKVKAEAEITRLLDLVGKGTYPDVTLYVGIANQYELFGDGSREYDYLGRAIQANATSSLPWHNIGVLMERLGALQTARTAYERATILQPTWKQWHSAYIEFLTTRMKGDTITIEKAFTVALQNLGQDAEILRLRTEWRNS